MDDAHASVREVVSRLRLPIVDVSTLLSLLAGPLDRLGLLPPKSRKHNTNPLPDGALVPGKSIPTLQQAILEHVIPTWHDVLVEEDAILLVEQYFCPDAFSFASPAAGEVTSLAYSSILALPLTDYSIHLLARLTKEYPIDRLHTAVFSSRIQDSPRKSITWEDCVRSAVTVPAKVANFLGGKNQDIPLPLEYATYFNNLSLRCECLIFFLSCDPSTDHVASVIALLTRLVHLGVFPPTRPTSRSQSSFFESTLSTIRARLQAEKSRNSYSAYWSNLLLSLPSTFTLQAVLTSLFSSLSQLSSGLDSLKSQRALVKREASLVRRLIGPLSVENEELWECVSGLFLSRDWGEGHGRIFACWVSGCNADEVDNEALALLLSKVVDMWSSPEHIKHSLLGRHHYITSLLLITASYLPPSSPEHDSLALSPAFISGVGMYISHLDNSVRHCGMLAAEVVAQRAGKKLDFGEWDGDDSGKPWARELRELIKARDVDAILDVRPPSGDGGEQQQHTADVEALQPKLSEEPALIESASGDDSDDSLTGYASPTSSRSASPTPSELDEIEKDPTLAVGVKKIPRPVYLAQLGEMVRSTGGLKANDASQEADKIEMAINCAEELIRKKRNYGTELEENTVNLAYGLIGLQDNYDLDGFEVKRQSAVNSLVVCCPRKAAPSLIEEFFKNQYSTNQRFAILNALALGARELASLPLPPSAVPPIPTARTSFPSKILPIEQHKKYIATGNQNNVIQHMLDSISLDVIEGVKSSEVDKVPELARERRLRIRKPAKITELTQAAVSGTIIKPRSPTDTTFTEVAAEFFIAPLINRFWLFLRDEHTREERTAHQETLHQYRGAGTGLILNPMVLAHFLVTLAVLVHAARNAPEWLAVVAPDALELAVTLGTRPVSQHDSEDHMSDGGENETKDKEASVLTAALELALIVLDGCLELDGGRSIGLDHTTLLLGTGEWAGRVFSLLEKGTRLPGGGAQDSKVRRAAAGVLLKVDALTSAWRRSMVNITSIEPSFGIS